MTRTRIALIAVTIFLACSASAWLIGLPHAAAGGTGANSLPVVALVPGTTGGDTAGTASGADPADTTPSASGNSDSGAGGLMPTGLVSAGWLATATTNTRIPSRVLQAYAAASIVTAKEHPDCHLGWNTLAAIGEEESAHGTTGGAYIDDNGHLHGTIYGPELDGGSYGRVPDTDNGALDGDKIWDRAVGPMQILPSTWTKYGIDGNGDGIKDPNDIDDATLAAADYLCTAGGNLATGAGWAAAVTAYNPSSSYVADVRQAANLYAKEGGA
jgi:hypothetical protein